MQSFLENMSQLYIAWFWMITILSKTSQNKCNWFYFFFAIFSNKIEYIVEPLTVVNGGYNHKTHHPLLSYSFFCHNLCQIICPFFCKGNDFWVFFVKKFIMINLKSVIKFGMINHYYQTKFLRCSNRMYRY